MSDVLAVFAASWGIVMGISPLLQTRRIVRRRSSADVSLSYLSVLLVGFALWMAYGLTIHNPALVIATSVAFVVGLATIAVAIRFRETS